MKKGMRERAGVADGCPSDRQAASLVHDRIGQVAFAQGHDIAVKSPGRRISYGELDSQANRLAHHLLEQLGPGLSFGIAVKATPELPIVLLAVLRAGGACVAVNPAEAPARIGRQLADCGVDALILGRGVELPAARELPCVRPHRDRPVIDIALDTPPDLDILPTDPAWRFDAGAATGGYKGASIEHAMMSLLFEQLAARLDRDGHAGPLQMNQLQQDLGAMLALLPLFMGTCLVLADPPHDPCSPVVKPWVGPYLAAGRTPADANRHRTPEAVPHWLFAGAVSRPALR